MRETKLTRGIEESGLEKAEGDVFVRCYGWGRLTSTTDPKWQATDLQSDEADEAHPRCG